MAVLENQRLNEIDALPTSRSWFVQFAARSGVTTSGHQIGPGSFREGPPWSVDCCAVEPIRTAQEIPRPDGSSIPVRFDDDPDTVAALVSDFESGKLQVRVTRSEEIELIREFFWIEFANDRSLFRGIVSGEVQKTTAPTEAAPIADERTANTARDILIQRGHLCRVTDGKLRISESKLVRNLADLGFTSEPAVTE